MTIPHPFCCQKPLHKYKPPFAAPAMAFHTSVQILWRVLRLEPAMHRHKIMCAYWRNHLSRPEVSAQNSFGPGTDDEHIISDFSYQALRILSGAEEEYSQLTPETTALIDGFTAGYNQYVNDTEATDLPAQCNAAPWVTSIRPQDLLAYYRIVGQYASGDLFSDGALFSAVPPGVSPIPIVSMDSSTLGSLHNTSDIPLQRVAVHARRQANTSLDLPSSSIGSNAWGIGSELSENGKGALLANPHFPYTGSRRFYQMHLSVPAYLNVHGAGLLGTALPLVSFNQNLGWSHTVSTSQRFTVYELTLKDDDDLVYVKDGQDVAITSETFRIEVANGTPTPTVLERDFYFSDYGPMLPADLLTGGALPAWGDEGHGIHLSGCQCKHGQLSGHLARHG